MALQNKDFLRKVFALVLPIALQNLINVAVTSADVVMMMLVGEIPLSAVSMAGQVQFILTLIYFGISSGAAVLCAQYWGKQNIRAIEQVLGISLRFGLAFGAGFTLLVLAFPDFIMRIFTHDPAVIAEGVVYLRIVAASYLFSAVSTIWLNVQRSIERAAIATITYFLSLVLNILINSVLIFGLFGAPKMGIAGAAVGTVCARLLEASISFWYGQTRPGAIRLHLRYLLHADKLLFKDFLHFSLPVTANELLWGAGTATLAVVIGHLGVEVISANSVASVVKQLSMVVSMGLANAAAVMLGKAIGSGEFALARTYAKKLVQLTLLSGVAGAAVILLIRPLVLGGFALTPEASSNLSSMLWILSYTTVAQAVNCMMVVGIFRSGGDTRFGLVVDTAGLWMAAIPLGAVAAYLLHAPVFVVYMLLVCDELIKLPFVWWRYKSERWLKNVTRN